MDRFDVFVALDETSSDAYNLLQSSFEAWGLAPWQLHVQAYTLPASATDAQEVSHKMRYFSSQLHRLPAGSVAFCLDAAVQTFSRRQALLEVLDTFATSVYDLSFARQGNSSTIDLGLFLAKNTPGAHEALNLLATNAMSSAFYAQGTCKWTFLPSSAVIWGPFIPEVTDQVVVHKTALVDTPAEKVLQMKGVAACVNLNYEVVVIRTTETVDWVAGISSEYALTVYNALPGDWLSSASLPARPFRNIQIDAFCDVTALHSARRYQSLAGVTIFAPPNALIYSPQFLDLLQSPSLLTTQSLTPLSLYDLRLNLPPKSVVDQNKTLPWVRMERISTRTLNSVYFHDPDTILLINAYLQQHRLLAGVNIVDHFITNQFGTAMAAASQEIIEYAYGGMFAVTKSAILRLTQDLYKHILLLSVTDPVAAEMIVRSWPLVLNN